MSENNNSVIVCEDLKNVKLNSKFGRKFNNRLQYWSYKQTISSLASKCEEQGVSLVKVSPAYTSQTCSMCGTIDKDNRKGELYECSCGMLIDADYNAAINILHRGAYRPSNETSNILL